MPRSDVDGVPVHMGRAAVGQEAVEGLLPVADVAGRDQRVGDVRAAHRGAVADLGQHLGLGDRHAELGQLFQHAGEPAHPAAADPLASRPPAPGSPDPPRRPAGARCCRAAQHESSMPRTTWMPTSSPVGDRLVQPVERVVVGQRDDVQPGVARLGAPAPPASSVPSETEEWVCRSTACSKPIMPAATGTPLSSPSAAVPDDPQPDRGAGQVGSAAGDRPQDLDRLGYARCSPSPNRRSAPWRSSSRPRPTLSTSAVSWACTACRSSRSAARAIVCQRSSRGSSTIRRQQPVQPEPLPEREVHLGHLGDVDRVAGGGLDDRQRGVRGGSTAIRPRQLVGHARRAVALEPLRRRHRGPGRSECRAAPCCTLRTPAASCSTAASDVDRPPAVVDQPPGRPLHQGAHLHPQLGLHIGLDLVIKCLDRIVKFGRTEDGPRGDLGPQHIRGRRPRSPRTAGGSR